MDCQHWDTHDGLLNFDLRMQSEADARHS